VTLDGQLFHSVGHLAHIMGVEAETIYTMIQRKKIKASKFCNSWFISEKEVRRFLEGG
jgi:excisionase family DNA binding protein